MANEEYWLRIFEWKPQNSCRATQIDYPPDSTSQKKGLVDSNCLGHVLVKLIYPVLIKW